MYPKIFWNKSNLSKVSLCMCSRSNVPSYFFKLGHPQEFGNQVCIVSSVKGWKEDNACILAFPCGGGSALKGIFRRHGWVTCVGRSLALSLKREFESVLRINSNLFSCNTSNIPGIDPDFFCHKLSILP